MLRLPVEVVTMILLGLPIKSLGQCKCVCKSWRSLISDPRFVKSHLNRATSDVNSSYSRLFMMYPFHSLDYESPSSFEDVDEDNHDRAIVDLGFPFGEPDDGVVIVGSCYGLICLLYLPDCFILWNPTTKDSQELPQTPCCSYSADGDLCFKGFGYVSSIDDYKVVRAPREAGSNLSRVEVYSLKDNSWRRIGDIQRNIVVKEEMGTCLNGTLHWLASCSSGPNRQGVIITLDLEEEKFCETTLPECSNKNISFHTLKIINECLSLLSNEGGCRDVVVWVMKEYGVTASWTKLVVLPENDFLFCNYLDPVCFVKNADIIIDIDGRTLVRYNLKEKTLRNLKNCSEDDIEWILYVESLISPGGYYGKN